MTLWISINKHLLGLFLLCVWSLRVCAENSTEWTFNIPGVSFISFPVEYSNSQKQHLGFRFKSAQPGGLLFCHYLGEFDPKELPQLDTYEVCGEIQRGVLLITYQLNQFSDVFRFGKGLNNDLWHDVVVYLDTMSGDFSVTLDGNKHTNRLKAYTYGDPKSILDWTKLSSTMSYGGIDPILGDTRPHFIGCMSNLKYERKDRVFGDVKVDTMEGVTHGCHDLCEENVVCQNGGRCQNKYTEFVCDCFGTEYEGQHCQDTGVTNVTIRGYEWFTYQLYEEGDDRLFTDRNRISLQFKTERGSGVLLYAVGGTPFHSHVTASVHAGSVQASVGFGSEDIEVTMGLNINDNRWHNLTIAHEREHVDFYLDGAVERRSITGDQVFLSLDSKVYFGGGHNFVITRGLQVTENFVGCLRNLYFNEVSVLHEIRKGNPHSQYDGGAEIQYGCHTVANVPISFPKSATMLLMNSAVKSSLEVEFEFRTVRKDAILFYVSLTSYEGRGDHFGYLEVWLRKGQPSLSFMPSSRHGNFSQNYTLPTMVNDNKWHALQLTFTKKRAKIEVDKISVVSEQHHRTLQHGGTIVIGYGFRGYRDSDGFVGCMRNVKVQGQVVDPIDILATEDGGRKNGLSANGVVLDGCSLVNHCQDVEICQHGAQCLSDWDGISCECADTGYEGKTCHFPKYRQSCNEYYQSGMTTSGVYHIDLDGSGPMSNIYVECIMGEQHGGHLYGETHVDHNLAPDTMIRGPGYVDMRKVLSYRGMNHKQLEELTINNSLGCHQHIQYDCINAPIRLGEMTWFKAASGHAVESLGTKKPGYCSCSSTDSCLADRCNCDKGVSRWEQDSGYNRVRKQLPVSEIVIKQNITSSGTAKITLGPLKCWGSKYQKPEQSVTFTAQPSYLVTRPWTSGDLKISFRTHLKQALIIHQAASADNPNTFTIKLVSDHRLTFQFHLTKQEFTISVDSRATLNDGGWHQIMVEHDAYNIRCTVDMEQILVDIPEGIAKVADYGGILYIGSVASEVPLPSSEDTSGFIGCIRGLAYNNKNEDLTQLIDPSIVNVFAGCTASCWPNPCQNGATCLENWGDHRCVCTNKWAHFGDNCEIDINQDKVTFTGAGNSYLFFTEGLRLQSLSESIILSFRTFERDAILLYMHDDLNNFIEIHLHGGENVTLRYNNYWDIISQTLNVPGLNDGMWKQMAVEAVKPDQSTYFRLIVEDKEVFSPYEQHRLWEYSPRPFNQRETIEPYRPTDRPEQEFVRVYVGGAIGNMSSIPPLSGCIRGLKIGQKTFHLQKEAMSKPIQAVFTACERGCTPHTCLNTGICEERWQNSTFECDCSDSDFAGDRCEIEASGKFYGQSVVEYQYNLPNFAQKTLTEHIFLTFRASSTVKTPMILMFIFSERSETHDFVLAYMNPESGVFIRSNQGYAKHGVGVNGRFADGEPHHLVYQRRNNEMILKLDDTGVGRVTVPDNTLDHLDTIMVGGIVASRIADNAVEYLEYSNFTGCLSEVTFIPVKNSAFRLKPMKELRDLQNGSVTVFGPDVGDCSLGAPPAVWPETTPGSGSTKSPFSHMEKLTLPPWNPGPAKTIYSGPTPPATLTTTSSTTSTTSSMSLPILTIRPTRASGNGSASSILNRKPADDNAAIIAICIIAFLSIIAIIIAVILIRMRRRQTAFGKKKNPDDIEMKQPLNHHPNSPVVSANSSNHIATLDEFSTVSATLGPSTPRRVQETPVKPEANNRLSYGQYSSIPMIDSDDPTYPQNFFNRRKNRPASSISEVLEEIERQKKAKDPVVEGDQVDSNPSPRSSVCDKEHGGEDLEWDPQTDTTPLTCKQEEDKESSSDLDVLEHNHGALDTEYNGDSGYEAESSKPDGDDDIVLENDTAGTVTPPSSSPDKNMYMYDITGVDIRTPNMVSAPNMTSTPRYLIPQLEEDGTFV